MTQTELEKSAEFMFMGIQPHPSSSIEIPPSMWTPDEIFLCTSQQLDLKEKLDGGLTNKNCFGNWVDIPYPEAINQLHDYVVTTIQSLRQLDASRTPTKIQILWFDPIPRISKYLWMFDLYISEETRLGDGHFYLTDQGWQSSQQKGVYIVPHHFYLRQCKV